MATEPLRAFLRRLRHGGTSPAVDGVPDAQLLERFVTRRDEAAFEVLVWRHSGLVLNVCGRVLRHAEDTEDVFQATFLALTRRAGSIRAAESLGSWLYKVAYRVALRARTARAATRPLRGSDEPERPTAESEIAPDLRAVLDEEINRLPEKYRTPVVLCYLQGRSTHHAARELGCPRGTVCSRLSWARRRLRARLARRGLALSTAGVSGGLAASPAPAALVASTVRAAVSFSSGTAAGSALPAVTLAEGVLRAMTLTKLKTMAMLALILGASGLVTGLGALRAAGTLTPGPQVETQLARKTGGRVPIVRPVRGEVPPPDREDPPSDQEVLRALPRVNPGIPHIAETFRDDIVIVKNRLAEKTDPPGPRRRRWECVVHYTETVQMDFPFPVTIKTPRTLVVYIDKKPPTGQIVEVTAPVLVRLANGAGDGICLPPAVLAQLGMQVAEAKARAHAPAHALEFKGSLALDPERVSHVGCLFAPAEVIEIGRADEKDNARVRQLRAWGERERAVRELAIEDLRRGNLKPEDVARLTAQVDQSQALIHAAAELRPGDRVRKGQLLAVLRSARVGEQKAAVFGAVRKLRESESHLDRARKDAGSASDEMQKTADELQIRLAEAMLETRKTYLESKILDAEFIGIPDEDIKAVIAAATRSDKLDPAQVKEWCRVELRAPADGTLVKQNITRGQVVVSKTQPLIRIANQDRLQVLAQVPEKEFPLLKALAPEERRWTVRTKADGQGVLGRFDTIGLVIDPVRHTALVTGLVDNPEGRLQAGQIVTVAVTLPTPPGEVALPVGAVVEEGGQTFVFVQPHARTLFYELRRVAVVRRGADVVHVRARLTAEQEEQGFRPVGPGDRVVTTGAIGLKGLFADLKAGTGR